MTGKTAFTEEEWQAIEEGPPVAGMLLLTAERGGSFRESFALAKVYAEARQQHGESELLDEIVQRKPTVDRHRYGSPEALHDQGLESLRRAVAALQAKGTPEDVDEYRKFVLSLAQRVAAAHKEGGDEVGQGEQAALDELTAALGAQGDGS
jgi:hypothetical protein